MNNHTILTKATRSLLFIALMMTQVLTGLSVATAQTYSDGETFTAQTVEGVDMTFKVLSVADMTCQVGDGSHACIASDVTAVTVPSEINGYAVTTIGNLAFKQCYSLASVTIPATVTSIGEEAFRTCNALTSIVLPSTLTTISASMFYDSGLTNITIPEGVTSIGNSAFHGCGSLATVNFPSTLLSIGDDAFSLCTALTPLNLPSSLQTVGYAAFGNCESVTSVTIPASVTTIADFAFGISALKWVTVESTTPPTIAAGSFGGSTMGDGALYVPQSAIDTYHNTEYWSQFNRIYAIGKHPYAVLEGNTLTFYCGDRSGMPSDAMELNFTSANNSPIYPHKDEITSVVFDDSFADFTELKSTGSWFYDCGNITSISGLEKVNTSKVTTMDYMFDGCKSLTSLDVSNFDWSSVQTMPCMFRSCSGLTNINLGNFNASSATSFSQMFQNCTSLETISISDANTSSATNMYAMFNGCRALTELNLGSFNTTNVTNMSNMFANCNALTTIYVGSGWTTAAVTDNGTGMFSDCNNLEGGAGTTWASLSAAYVENCNNYQFAHIDGGAANPGYLTDVADTAKVNEPYAVLSDENTKLTFYYDKKKAVRSGMDIGPFGISSVRGWFDNRSSITRVVFDASFANDTTITSTAYWFSEMNNLAAIDGLLYLKTQNVTDMSGMFDGCSSLTSLDVTGFDTKNVKYIDSMFRYCSGLTNLDVTSFNTLNVTGMYCMFDGCSGLTSLDVASFNTQNVDDMRFMFDGCSSLTTIYAGSEWSTANVTNSTDMFTGCTSLVGGEGTTYDADHTDHSYAHIDGGTSNPGYLTDIADYGKEAYVVMVDNKLTFYYDKMKDSRMGTITTITTGEYHAWTNSSSNVTEVIFDESFANYTGLTSTAQWFWSLQALTTITNLNFLNTSNVINMSQMFGSCSGLLSLDLSNFNTSKATDISKLFTGCEKLTSLNLSNFDTSNVTDMNNLFRDCHGLTSIDLSSFNTTKVTDMWGMFMNCDHIKVIDISSFNTSNVTNMNYMFAQNDDSHELKTIYVGSGWSTESVSQSGNMFSCCYNLWGGRGSSYDAYRVLSLEYIKYAHIDGGFDNPGFFTEKDVPLPYTVFDGNVFTFYYDKQMDSRDGMIVGEFYNGTPWYNLSNVVTSVVFDESFANCTNLTTTSYWFREFSNLESITGLDILKTDNVVNMQGMFYTCEKIKELNVGSFNTSKVNNMRSMFWGCKSLKVLDLSSFNTANVTNISYMFCQCDSLKTIYVGNTWTIDAVNSGENTFLGSDKLVGGEGTTYDYNHVDYTYAHIDGGPDNPGYFTDIADMGKVNEAYAALDGTTLTFYYDKKKTDRNGLSVGPFTSEENRGWNDNAFSITSVIFDNTFANDTTLTSTANWFSYCNNLTTITGIKNLKTANVTDMGSMFFGCSALTNLDVSGFNTANVTDMGGMFYGCSALTSLDLSNFNTANVTSMYAMFNGCRALTELNLGSFNTANVTNMGYMFFGCSALTNLDVSGFNTANVTYMGGMFAICSGLTSLDVSSFNTANVTNMGYMFAGCSSLTSLDVNGFKTENVTAMQCMFANDSTLTTIDLSGFNTSKVELMNNMFDSCTGLTSLDLSSFNTANATNMGYMFFSNVGLKTIYVGNGWSTNSVTSSDDMFTGCTALVGGQGTTYDASHVDVAYAHIDGGTSNPGYFTPKGGYVEAPTFAWNADELTMTSGTDGATIYYTLTDAVTSTPTPTQYTAPITVTNDVLIEAYAEKDGMARSMTTVLDYPYTAWTQLVTAIADAQNVVVSADGNDNVTAEQLDSLMFQISVAQGMYIARTDSAAAITQFTTELVTLTETIRQLVNAENEPYAVLAGNTLTFYYDKKKTDRNGLDVGSYTSAGLRPWNSESSTITTVVFDPSFADYRLTSTAWWFYSMGSLTTITGIDNLKTNSVTSMAGMFQNCESLTSLDLRGFNTSNVESMVNMFYGCKNLTSIDLSNFNTANVTSMASMFYECQNLSSIDLSSFNTSSVMNMSEMFENCSAMTSLDVSSFNTANVTTMSAMFSGCTGLTVLDISSFNTAQVTEMTRMFGYCTNLKTIYVGSNWSATQASGNGNGMFVDCTSLVGGAGTVYNSGYIDWTYAHVDGGPDNPGYLTLALAMGDANGDGSINIADAVATVTNILGQPADGSFYRYAADMNNDTVIDIFDVTLIVNAVFDANKPAPALTRGGINVPAEAIRLTADANHIYMDIDQAQQYTAFQFDIDLPEGMELASVQLASGRTDHQVKFVKRGDNEYRVVGLSMNNEVLSSADGHLVQLQVSNAASDGNVKVSNALFVTPAGNTVTGIGEYLNTTMTNDVDIYNLKGEKLGKSLQQLGKGIYIMNHKKVIIK